MSDDGKGPETRRPSYWLIVTHETGATNVFTIDLDDGRKALAVFSFEEEAGLFLRHELPETGWRVKETTIGELVSALYGLYADAGKMVALDPLPSNIYEGTNRLLSLRRGDFVQTLIDKRGVPAATLGQSSLPLPRKPLPERARRRNRRR